MAISRKFGAVCFTGMLLTGCAGFPPAESVSEPFSGDGQQPVFVLHHGWHTGIVIHSAEIGLFADHSGWLEFGWGDEQFYQAGTIDPLLAARAVVWPTASVIRMRSLSSDPTPYLTRPGVVKLCVREDQLTALETFLEASFARDRHGRLIPAAEGAPVNGRFFRAQGSYFLTRTCNAWVARALASAGVNLSGVFTATAGSLMRALHALESVETLRYLDQPPSSRSADALSCA